MFNITFFTNSCCIVKSTVRSAEEVSGQVCAASSAVWGADKDLVQSNFPPWHCLSVHLPPRSLKADDSERNPHIETWQWWGFELKRDLYCRSVNASSLHNPTKDVAQATLGHLEGSFLLLVLNVDAGPMFHQQLGCFHALLVTGQVAGNACKENCKYKYSFYSCKHYILNCIDVCCIGAAITISKTKPIFRAAFHKWQERRKWL